MVSILLLLPYRSSRRKSVKVRKSEYLELRSRYIPAEIKTIFIRISAGLRPIFLQP